MKYILDTHALIWFLEGNARLGLSAKEILLDSSLEAPETFCCGFHDHTISELLEYLKSYYYLA